MHYRAILNYTFRWRILTHFCLMHRECSCAFKFWWHFEKFEAFIVSFKSIFECKNALVKLFHRLSLTCWLPVGGLWVKCRPTVGRLLADCWWREAVLHNYPFQKNLNKSVGQLSARCCSTVGQQIADSRPTDYQQSADR